MEAAFMFIGRKMDKEVVVIYTMEYDSAIKKEHFWISSNEVDIQNELS